MRVLLLIGGVWNVATTDSSTDPDINIIWDNLANPSITTDNYTFNLLLPRCDDNDKLFSHFCLLDSVITGGGYDPTHAIPVKCLADDGACLINGKAIVESISGEQYSLSVCGKLADVWTSLLNSGWDTSRTDDVYTRLPDEFSTSVNAEMVADSFKVAPSAIPFDLSDISGQGASLAVSYGITNEENAVAVSMMGFAPTAQGKPIGLDSTQWLTLTDTDNERGEDPEITSIFCTIKNADGSEVNGKNGTSCVEAQMAQYRSYNQQPYIYISKLWQLYRKSCSLITGYEMNLDTAWFNANNPLLKDVIFTLPQTYDGTDAKFLRTNSSLSPVLSAIMQTGAGMSVLEEVGIPSELTSVGYLRNTNTITSNQYQKIAGSLAIRLDVGAVGTTFSSYGLSALRFDKATMFINVRVGSTTIKKMALLVIPDNANHSDESYKSLAFNDPSWPLLYRQGYRLVVVKAHGAGRNGGAITLDTIQFTTSTSLNGVIRIDVGFINYGSISPFVVSLTQSGHDYTAHTGVGSVTINLQGSTAGAEVYQCNRSNKELTLGTLFGGVSPFSILMRYSKLMRLSWSIDEESRTINIKRTKDVLAECFNDVTDISGCVDGEGDWQIMPLSWSSHNVILNYQPTEMVDYEKRYGMPYGSKMIVTANELNDDTEMLLCNGDLDTIASPILATETLPTRYSIVTENAPQNTITNYAMIMNHKNGESANAWGAFFIRRSNAHWHIGLAYRDGISLSIAPIVAVTDDTDYELDVNTFVYHNLRDREIIGNNEILQVTGTRPVFDICDNSQTLSIQLAPTQEAYTANNYPSSMRYLYDNVWAGYIGELYNAQNKTLIVNAYLTNDILYKMRTNPIVKIDNILYMVCKVEGWKASTRYARLTLRQIFDKSNFSA